MPKIFITRPVPGKAESMLREKGHDVTVNPHNEPLSREMLIKTLSEGQYDGVLSLLHDTIDSGVFDAAPSVKIFANYAVGYNNFDLDSARAHGVTVTNTPSNAVNESVGEHTFALMLALAHRIAEGDRYVRAGSYTGWDPNLLIGLDIKGKILGVIGAGRIGTSVIQKAVQGFGMRVVYYDIVRNEYAEKEYGAVFKETVDEVLTEADIVTLHVNLSDETTHLINTERLALMKRDALLINTCRGPVVDEQALQRALSEKVIRGAAIDVYEFEPKVADGLTSLSNIVLTPHIASATEASRNDMSDIAARNLIEFFDGKKPTNTVT